MIKIIKLSKQESGKTKGKIISLEGTVYSNGIHVIEVGNMYGKEVKSFHALKQNNVIFDYIEFNKLQKLLNLIQ